MSKVSKIHCTDFNALNGIFVRDGVCGFYTTLYAEYRLQVGDVEDAETHLISLKSRSKLRTLPPNQLKLDKSGIQGIVGKDQRKGWPIMQMSYLVNDRKY